MKTASAPPGGANCPSLFAALSAKRAFCKGLLRKAPSTRPVRRLAGFVRVQLDRIFHPANAKSAATPSLPDGSQRLCCRCRHYMPIQMACQAISSTLKKVCTPLTSGCALFRRAFSRRFFAGTFARTRGFANDFHRHVRSLTAHKHPFQGFCVPKRTLVKPKRLRQRAMQRYFGRRASGGIAPRAARGSWKASYGEEARAPNALEILGTETRAAFPPARSIPPTNLACQRGQADCRKLLSVRRAAK